MEQSSLQFENGLVQLYQGDARRIPLPDNSVHCIVTSPPFYGLRQYKGAGDGVLGLEETLDEYINALMEVMSECRRVLRSDGVMWINISDCYAGSGKGQNGDGTRNLRVGPLQSTIKGTLEGGLPKNRELPGGNLLGVPWRLTAELQRASWMVRDVVIWDKPAPKPEAVRGTRWERCRVKVGSGSAPPFGRPKGKGFGDVSSVGGENRLSGAQWVDCPGCAKCACNGGYVLRRGSWRPTISHEYLLMVTQGMGYYGDGEEVRRGSGGNRLSVWADIAPEPYSGDHHAVFPTGLPKVCIQASTSEVGVCPGCGAQWARVVERPEPCDSTPVDPSNGWGRIRRDKTPFVTVGWLPSCDCGGGDPVPALVLDPFVGTGTTCLAAQRLGRRSLGVDLSGDYLVQAVEKLSGADERYRVNPGGPSQRRFTVDAPSTV